VGDKIKILIADDHPVVRLGVLSFLTTVEDLNVVGEASDGREAVDLAQVLRPDVILMDLKMPGMNGVEATREILAHQPGLRVIILTSSGFEELVFAAVRAGAVGYLAKTGSFEEVLHAIRRVHRGELVLDPEIIRGLLRNQGNTIIVPTSVASDTGWTTAHQEIMKPSLTKRQIQILRRLAEGLNSQQIAGRIGVSESTVRSHISHILTKLGLEGRSALLRALRQARSGGACPLPQDVVDCLGFKGQPPAQSATHEPESSATLTQREIEVTTWLARGLSNQHIGNRLHISEATVRTHVSRLLKKLGLSNRVEAALFALRQGWAELG
jgi:DNA-binding NarL/FixJ family response regulator